MWYNEATIYQIYPLGLCGAPTENDGKQESRIRKLISWIDEIKVVGADTVLLNPMFSSDRHGYDTRDYFQVDCRLGSNADLAEVCKAFHQAGLRVIFDGVFNHVGRGFWAFQDVQKKREESPYQDWFYLDFQNNNAWNDGFSYQGWEGCYDLVKLNLQNPAVIHHQFEAIQSWIEQYDIDGLRLDVAYSLPLDYLEKLRGFVNGQKGDFLLLGETLHGDYNRWLSSGLCDSVTNYECYKGLWSSLNSGNLFEIAHSLGRQFGPEPWTLYQGAHLLSFLDNHDVTRIASQLTNPKHLRLAYALLFGMPGVPCIYYGSEWGILGRKTDGDAALRPPLEQAEPNELTAYCSPGKSQKGKQCALLWKLSKCADPKPTVHF